MLVVQEISGPRAHQGRVPPLRETRLLRHRPRSVRPPGRRHTQADIPTIRNEIVPKVPDAQVMDDLDATVAFAGLSGSAGREAARHHRLLLGRAHRLALRRPHQHAESGRGLLRYPRRGRLAPLGAETAQPRRCRGRTPGADPGPLRRQDDNIPMPIIEQMQKGLKDANSSSRIEVFADAPHGFHADYRPDLPRRPGERGVGQGAGVVQGERGGVSRSRGHGHRVPRPRADEQGHHRRGDAQKPRETNAEK